MSTPRDIWAKLRNPGYRRAFAAEQCKRLIPFQVRALRKRRGLSQEELARLSGLTQGVVSRAEDPDNGNLTFNTAIRIANGFDVVFVGKFISFSEFEKWYSELSEDSVDAPSFEKEDSERKQLADLIGSIVDIRPRPGQPIAPLPQGAAIQTMQTARTPIGEAGTALVGSR